MNPLNTSGKMWQLKFEAPGVKTLPGQFVNIEIEGHYLRRPISVSEYKDGYLSLIVDAIGEGTRKLVNSTVGKTFNMLTELGNSFSLIQDCNVILIGGGVGFAPLIGLMTRLKYEIGINPVAFFGFNGLDDVPVDFIKHFIKKGFEIFISTMTGETGFKGTSLENACNWLKEKCLDSGYFYTCGPFPMMKAVADNFDFDGQLSLEARMGCGFGACMGCTVKTKDGPKRICKEGPVFYKKELIW